MARIRVRDVILEDMQPVIWGTTIPFAIICPISCAIRLYARKFISKSFGLDDWFMFVGSFVWIGQQYIAVSDNCSFPPLLIRLSSKHRLLESRTSSR